jgi:hypothetical protein
MTTSQLARCDVNIFHIIVSPLFNFTADHTDSLCHSNADDAKNDRRLSAKINLKNHKKYKQLLRSKRKQTIKALHIVNSNDGILKACKNGHVFYMYIASEIRTILSGV